MTENLTIKEYLKMDKGLIGNDKIEEAVKALQQEPSQEMVICGGWRLQALMRN